MEKIKLKKPSEMSDRYFLVPKVIIHRLPILLKY